MPDVTRLLDRMEEAGLVERTRDTEDRRMVSSRITKKSMQLLSDLDPLVADNERHFFAGISRDQIQTLIDVLDVVRHAEG